MAKAGRDPKPTPRGASKRQNLTVAGKDEVVIPGIENRDLVVRLMSTSPGVQHRFGTVALDQIIEDQTRVGPKPKPSARPPKDFDREYYENGHRFGLDGAYGWPATSFKNSIVAAGILVGLTQTSLRRALYIVADGFEYRSGTPLVRIEGEPIQVFHDVRLSDGKTSVVTRPMFKTWACELRVRYDSSIIDAQNVIRLIQRAGAQIGIGEGRIASKKSTGMGWGSYELDLQSGVFEEPSPTNLGDIVITTRRFTAAA